MEGIKSAFSSLWRCAVRAHGKLYGLFDPGIGLPMQLIVVGDYSVKCAHDGWQCESLELL